MENRAQRTSYSPPYDIKHLSGKNKWSPLCFGVNKVKNHFCYKLQDENKTLLTVGRYTDFSGALSRDMEAWLSLMEQKHCIFILKASHL